jgi:hypothetical protein
MKNNIQISIILIAIVSFTIFLVINEKRDRNHTCNKGVVEEIEQKINSNDSIIILVDNKLKQQKIDRNKKIHDIDSLSETLSDKKKVIEHKNITIEEKVNKLNKVLIEAENKKRLAERNAAIADSMKITAEKNRISAEIAKEKSLEQINKLQEENNKIRKEVNKLKEECIRLNGLLGNDYNTNKIDSIVSLPDSIKVNLNSKNKKKRKNKK